MRSIPNLHFFILTSTAFLLLYSHKKASFLGLYVDNVLHEISLLCQKRMTRHDIIIYDDDKKGVKAPTIQYCIMNIPQTPIEKKIFFYSSQCTNEAWRDYLTHSEREKIMQLQSLHTKTEMISISEAQNALF